MEAPTAHPIYEFPEPATPADGAIVNDWRHQAFTLELQEVEIKRKEFIYKETYSKSEIIDHAKPKGKANKKAFIFFAMPIIK